VRRARRSRSKSWSIRQVSDERFARAVWATGRHFCRPTAYWALVGPEVDLRRSVYDFQAAAEAVGRTGFPEREDLASGIVRPPSAEEAITVFERSVGQAYPA
jgi:hypothetical protein